MQSLTLGNLFLIVAVIGWITGKIFKRIIYRSWLIEGWFSGMWWHYAVVMFGLSWPLIGSTAPILEYEGPSDQFFAVLVVMLAFYFSWLISKRPNRVEKRALQVIRLFVQGTMVQVHVALRKRLLEPNTVSVITTAGNYSVFLRSADSAGSINLKGEITNFKLLREGKIQFDDPKEEISEK